MIIVDRTRLGPIDPHAGSFDELWTNGPAAPAEAAVLAQDQLIFDTIDQAQVFDAADYLGITWTFGYLTALAGLVGLVSVGALLLYVETRQRTRVAAYALGAPDGPVPGHPPALAAGRARAAARAGVRGRGGAELGGARAGARAARRRPDPAADAAAGAAGRRAGRLPRSRSPRSPC